MIVRSGLDYNVVKCTRIEGREEHKGLVQIITLRLANRVTVSGRYVSPRTPAEVMVDCIGELLEEFGRNHIMIGDWNSRNRNWDKMSDRRGNALVAMKNQRAGLWIKAATEPTFRKRAKRVNGTPRQEEPASFGKSG